MTGEGFGAECVVDVVCPRSHSRQAVQVRGGNVVDVVPPESVHGHQEDLTAAGVYPQPQDQEEEHGHRHAVEGASSGIAGTFALRSHDNQCLQITLDRD